MTVDFYFHSSNIYKSQEQYKIYRKIFSHYITYYSN